MIEMEVKFICFKKRFANDVRLVSNISVPDANGIEGPFYAAIDTYDGEICWQSTDWHEWDEVSPAHGFYFMNVGGKNAAIETLLKFAEKSAKPYTIDETFDWGVPAK